MASTTPHDALFKFTFSNTEVAASLLRSQLPRALVEAIDWTTLVLTRGSFVDEALSDRHTDLLFTCVVRGRTAFIYLLLEHQSTPNLWMPYRMLLYVVRIWERWRADHPNATALPLVLPIVLHHGPAAWNHPLDVFDLVDLDDDLRDAVGPNVPSLAFVLDDLAEATDEALRDRALAAFAEVTLRALARLRDSAAPVDELKRWLPLLRRMLRSRSGLQRLRAILEYVHSVVNVEPTELRDVVAQLGPAAEEVYMTTAQRLIDQGKAEGLAEGKVEGIAEGKVEGLAEGKAVGIAEGATEIVLRLLRLRFGELPSSIEHRVRSADDDERARFAERVLSATSLDDVFA